MALRGAIAGCRVTECTSVRVWRAVVVDIDEVEADDPRAGAEDHRRLLHEELVNDLFEFSSGNGVELCECVIVGVSVASAVGHCLD